MITISGETTHPVEVREDTAISGVSSGAITIHAGANLALSGVSTGTVTVLAGGKANISGVTDGQVRVEAGGYAQLSGIFSGAVTQNDGEIWVQTGMLIGTAQVKPGGVLGPAEAMTVRGDAPTYLLQGTHSAISIVPSDR